MSGGIIVCAPYSPADAALVATSATVITADCGHRVFIGPASLAMIARHPGRVRTECGPCSPAADLPTIAALARLGLAGLPPGTAAELTKELGTAEADQFLTWARNVGIIEHEAED